jgi:peroxisomal 3,2-trans-enoyl-CoA isomerase
LLAAINGPAIGASVTSATLCDAIIAAEGATFSTPFVRLGLPPEGCSSVHFDRIMKWDLANKLLNENYVASAQDACNSGMVMKVVPSDQLLDVAQSVAEEWIKIGKERNVACDLKAVNLKESEAVATAFLSAPFLKSQYKFLYSKGKMKQAHIFWTLALTRPVWKFFLKQ